MRLRKTRLEDTSRLAEQQLPPFHAKLAVKHEINCLRVSNVLLFENASGESLFVIRLEHRNCLLHDDGTVVEFFIHEVHGAARDFHTVSKCLFLCFQTRKGWKQ